MGTVTERSFTEAELKVMQGETPKQRVEATARSAAVLLPQVLAVALALLFALVHADAGQIGGALLIVYAPRIFSTALRFAPKR